MKGSLVKPFSSVDLLIIESSYNQANKEGISQVKPKVATIATLLVFFKNYGEETTEKGDEGAFFIIDNMEGFDRFRGRSTKGGSLSLLRPVALIKI
jgi:hypothetical protein